MEAETHSAAELRPPPTGWRFSPRGIALRLFITCWLIYVLHFATNTVREIYLALAIGDHFSFRVDEYAHMHPDLFEKEGYGWHIGANPGASMIAAVPYAVARPLIDGLVERTNQRRAAAGLTEPPAYNSPWPMAREFYREAWRRGYDIKFGLGAFVIQAFCMAPISALGVVAMFFALRRVFDSDRAAFWLALLYAFGTPVFFRTGYLNHNLMLGHVAFWGFLALWNPAGSARPSARMRYLLAGLSGGAAVLLDYSGVMLLAGLLVYGVFRIEKKADSDQDNHPPAGARIRHALFVGLGALGPIVLLWFYQWGSFGHPFYPGQHWMPPVEWIELGYQGFTWPQLDLLAMLAFDYRFGLFVSSPIMLLALAAPFVNRGQNRRLDTPELAFVLVVPLALWLFFGGVHYTKLQFGGTADSLFIHGVPVPVRGRCRRTGSVAAPFGLLHRCDIASPVLVPGYVPRRRARLGHGGTDPARSDRRLAVARAYRLVAHGRAVRGFLRNRGLSAPLVRPDGDDTLRCMVAVAAEADGGPH